MFKVNNKDIRYQVFCKESVLKNFAKSTGKHLSGNLFNKVAKLATLLKRDYETGVCL